MMPRRLLGFLLAVVLVGAGAACDDNDADEVSASSGEHKTAATLSDFKIDLDESEIGSGEVEFDIENRGPSVHEFVVFSTELPEGELPTKDGNVDEEGDGVKPVDEVEDIDSGATEKLEVDLDPGTYVVVCNVPGHYKLGMHATLTVD